MTIEDDDQKRPDSRDSTALSSADNSFAGFVDTYEDDDEAVNQRMIQGTRIKFTNQAKWTDAQGVELDSQLRLIAEEMRRVVNKWPPEKGPPLETIELAPGQPWPNVKKLNAACPQSEWRTDLSGKLKGPWDAQRLLYLLDPVTLDKFTYATATIGGMRALHELADKIAWAQRRRGPGVRPLVTLSATWMPTKHGGRLRPHFVVLPDWILPEGGSGQLVHKPAPQISGPAGAAAKPRTVAETLDVFAGKSDPPATAPAPSQEQLAKAGLQTVREPSLTEEMQDSIKF